MTEKAHAAHISTTAQRVHLLYRSKTNSAYSRFENKKLTSIKTSSKGMSSSYMVLENCLLAFSNKVYI